MAISAQDVYDRINNLVPTSTGTPYYPIETLEFAVEAARIWHSRLIPKPAVQLGTGDGSQTDYDLPDDMVRLKRIEYPFGTAPPAYLNSEDWEVHRGTAGLEVVFDTAPGSGKVFGVHYSGVWGLSDMDEEDRSSLSYLACAWLCMRRAAAMADTIDPIINADVINYGSKARVWMQLKDHFVNLYAQTKGLSSRAVREGKPQVAFGKASSASKKRYDRWWWWTE